jgi:hypothetical protein
MTRVITPGIGTTPDLSRDEASRFLYLIAKLDRPVDLSAPEPQPQQDYFQDTPLDQVLKASLPRRSYTPDPGLAEFGRAFEFSNATEQQRQAQDKARPRKSEDRLASALDRIADGTYTPRGQFARDYGFASPAQGSTTGMATCDVADEFGFCRATTHQLGCGSSAASDVTLAVQSQMRQMAVRPYADADGKIWADQEFGAPMTLMSLVEASTGQRLGDKDLFESGRPRRGTAAVQRPYVHGDPDEPGTGQPFPADTVAKVRALAAQRGIATSESHQAQRDAWKAQHGKLQARIGRPRSADYAELSNPVHRETGLAQVGSTWNGSQPVYAATGAAGTGDEWLLV